MKTTFTRPHFEHRPLAELSTGLLHRGMMLIIMLLSVMSLQAKVGDTFTQGNLKFTVLTEDGDKGTVSVGCATQSISGELNIPDKVKNDNFNYVVTSIRERGFKNCSGLTGSLVIPNSVTSIGDYAFFYCQGFTGLSIPNSVTSIGEDAFCGCSGFTGTLFIPNSVTSIGHDAFYSCSGFTGTLIIPSSIKILANNVFCRCVGLTGVVIPNSITTIDSGALESCGFTEVNIPNSVTSIGDYAFSWCKKLTKIVIPNSVTYLGHDAFANCSALKDIKLPNSISSIGEYTFLYCTSLTGFFDIPSSVTSIGESAFNGCSGLTGVNIPNSVTSIGKYAFDMSQGMKNVCIPSWLDEMYCNFEDNGLKELTIPYSACNNKLTYFFYDDYWKIYFMGTDLSSCGYFKNSKYMSHTYVKPSVYEKYKDSTKYNNLRLSDRIPVTFPANKKYVTLCRDFDVDLRHVNDNLPEGVEPLKAYIVDDADGDLKMVFMEEIKYIPSRLKANVEGYKGMEEYVGVVLKGTPGYTYYYQMGEDDYSKGAAGQMTIEKARALSGSSAKAMRAKRANSTSKASAYLVGAAQATEVKAEETVDGVTYKTYGLKNGSFLEYESDGIIPYNKAYLRIPIAKTPVEAKAAVTMYFNNDDGTTDIEKIDLDNKDSVLGQTAKDAMYNVNGVKVDNNYHGLVIVNGHKYMKK